MSKIKQVLMLHAQGVSNRKIGRELGLYKGTVNSYVQKIRDHGYGIDELLKLDEPVLESKLFAGNPAYKQDRFEEFKVLIPGIEKELSRPHVTRYLLWQEYRESHPDGYGYSQFCFHLDQVINARKPGSIIHYNPAEKLLVDFAGDTVSYVDQLTGEMIETQVFVACLPFSNYTFVMAVPSQRTEDFLHALTCCLNHLGGSPKILVTDNLKSAVIKTDRYEPELNRLMDDLAIHHGLVVIPTRTSKPKDKAPVENEVKIVYRRVYAKLRNHTFFSIDEINRTFAEKTREHNQTRQQQKDYCRDKHFYSVPYQYIGEKAEVVYTRSLVRIYVRGKRVATHQRNLKPGYTTLKEHMGSNHNFYNGRSPEFYIRQAAKHSDVLARLFAVMFERSEYPETQYRRCDGLLSLQRKTDPLVFERVCHYALDNGILSYKSIKNVIDNKAYLFNMAQQDQENRNNIKHVNIRGKRYYLGK